MRLCHRGELDAIKPKSKHEKMFIGEVIVRNNIVGQAEVGVAVRRQSLDLLEHVLGDGFRVSSFTNSLRAYAVPAKVTFNHVLHELRGTTRKFLTPMPKCGSHHAGSRRVAVPLGIRRKSAF
jgi:hypothetical protein